ncbi:MAG: prepilin-type N-terminal cleavage/methylation domain-containing protein [Candidatus Sulfotelmatobacter sp.]
MASTKTKGFSLLELMMTLTISLILTGIGYVTLEPTLQQQRVNDAYNITLTSLRHARDQAAADMRIYVVSFSPPLTTGPSPNGGTVTATQNTTTGTTLFSITLPPDVTYHVEPGVPTSPTTAPTTPDGFGSAGYTFDFDQGIGAGGGTTIYFYPDGTARDINGNLNNGVVYLGRPGALNSCRAITLWGATSRIRGWRLNPSGTSWSWSQQ